jgi:hypothetical protein
MYPSLKLTASATDTGGIEQMASCPILVAESSAGF